MAPKITAPVADFDGKVVGVVFTNGCGETEDPAALAYFGRQGYTIGETATAAKPSGTAQGAVSEDGLEALKSDELKAIAKDLGVSGSGKKPEIIARIREARAKAKPAEPAKTDGEDPTGDGGTGEEQTGDGENGAKPAEDVAGSSDHASVREVSE